MNNKQVKRWAQGFLVFVLVVTGAAPIGGLSSTAYADEESVVTEEPHTSDQETSIPNTVPTEESSDLEGTESPTNEDGDFDGTESEEPDGTGIISIADARVLAPNTNVAVSGVVTYSELSGEFTNYYIQDEEAGIVVRAKNQVDVGDRIEVYGPITHYSGLVQIEKDKSGFTEGYMKVTEQNVTLPGPKNMVSTDFVRPADQSNKGPGEKYEGMFVEVRDIQVTRGSSSTFYATDSHGAEMTIYAKNSPTALTVGKTYEYVQGVLTFNSNYGLEILPRTAADVVENSLSVMASVPSGGIPRNNEVTLTSPAKSAVVHYTTDNTEPTSSSAVYSSPIVIDQDIVIKAVAILNGQSSAVYTFTYQILPDKENVRIHDIQGAGHTSVFNGYDVKDIEGIVTSVSTSSFYMQELPGEMDDDNRTSEAIQVYKPSHGVIVGNQVKVSGKVTEYGAVNELTTTQITASTIVKVINKVDLPAPVKLGVNGRVIPTVIDSDSFAEFNPEMDAIDFLKVWKACVLNWKSLKL